MCRENGTDFWPRREPLAAAVRADARRWCWLGGSENAKRSEKNGRFRSTRRATSGGLQRRAPSARRGCAVCSTKTSATLGKNCNRRRPTSDNLLRTQGNAHRFPSESAAADAAPPFPSAAFAADGKWADRAFDASSPRILRRRHVGSAALTAVWPKSHEANCEPKNEQLQRENGTGFRRGVHSGAWPARRRAQNAGRELA